MDNGKVFFNNLITGDNTIVSDQQTGFEGKYLYDVDANTGWRSPDISQQTIRISFGSVTPVQGIVVLNHNLVSGDTFVFEASGDGFSSTAESISIDPAKGYAEVDWNYPDYRLRLQKTSGSYIEIKELFLGSCYTFEMNYLWNYEHFQEIGRITHSYSSGKVTRKNTYEKQGYTIHFTGISDTQKNKIMEINRSPYICFLPTFQVTPLFGVADSSRFKHSGSNSWDCEMTFRENPS